MNYSRRPKTDIAELAYFGGSRLFETPKPTSNLVRPDTAVFFNYASRIFDGSNYLVQELEERLAVMHGVRHCITMNSGFWALALLIHALHINGCKEVVLPSLTYRRMADIIAWVGLVPHFCDIDNSTLAVNAEMVSKCLNINTALILGVHPVCGHCDIDGLVSISENSGIPLIFDSVESVHERHKNINIGSFGNAELFSLGASKLINGFEGGYITTNDLELDRRLRSLRKGIPDRKGVKALSAEIIEVHAAMALAGLDDLDAQLERNRRRFDAYRRELAGISGLRLLIPDEEISPSHKNIVVEVLDGWPYTRDQTIHLLNAEMILARAYYAPPLTDNPMSYTFTSEELPNTNQIAKKYISMPCGHFVTLEDITEICDFLHFIESHKVEIGARLNSNFV